jgi:hypothetical protein
MATRMQQRRGTALQWTSADPILAAGEIGFETDTGQFKIGDGTNVWSSLSYFKDMIDLGGSLDDYVPVDMAGQPGGFATLDGDGAIPMIQLANIINGAPSTLDTLQEIGNELTAIDGIVNVAKTEAVTEATTSANAYTNQEIIDVTADLQTYANQAVSAATATLEDYADQVGLSAIADAAVYSDQAADAAEAAAIIAAGLAADTKVSDHNSDIINVHGISDTSALATKAGIETLTNKTISAADNNVTVNLSDVVDVTASASEVNILDGATLSVTELNYVDGVTSNIQTQLDAKAPTANPTFTGTLAAADISITGDLTVGGTTTTVNATDLVVTDPLIYIGEGNSANIVDLGLVSSFNDGAYQHAGIVRDATDGVWKLFSSVEDEPTTTVNFSQAVYDTLKVGGIEYADGVQVKQGVPSITTINQQAGAYTTVLTDRDKLVEVSSASGVTVTIPANSSVAYPVGTSIDILQTGAGQVTIAGAGGVTVNATPGLKLRTQWSSATLFKRATDTWVVFGDLSA